MFIDEIVRSVLQTLDRGLEVTSTISPTELKFCNLKWIKLFNYVSVDGTLIKIVSIDENTNVITFSQNVSPTSDFKIPDTVMFIGSAMKTSSEWLNYSNLYSDKVPFVWVNFPSAISVEVDESGLSPIVEFWKNVRIFFIADMDRAQWLSQDTLDQRTKVLYEWAREFKITINKVVGLELTDSSEYNFFPIFGKEQENGSVQDIIEGNLSGIALNCGINVFSDFECYC